MLNQTRHQLAKGYRRQHQLNLADIACLLGYREQSAFKDWFSISPGSYSYQLQ